MEKVFRKNTWLKTLKAPDKILIPKKVVEEFNRSVNLDIFSFFDLKFDFSEQLNRAKNLRVSNAILEKVEFLIGTAEKIDRYIVAVKRGAMRNLPIEKPLYRDKQDDLDRIQETGFEIGEEMRAFLQTTDGKWLYVVTPYYSGWTKKENTAEIEEEQLRKFINNRSFYIVTGNYLFTIPSSDKQISLLMFGMGARLIKGDSSTTSVSGEEKTVQKVIKVPVRGKKGTAVFKNAFIPFNADVSNGFLQFTRRNILNESFKLLGERYGWGDSFQARDCSSTVRSIFKTMGVFIPRNTSDQEVMRLGKHVDFRGLTDAEKLSIIQSTFQLGDLLFMEGHVMIYFGEVDGIHYIYHNFHRRFSDRIISVNGVSITPITIQFKKGITALSLIRTGIILEGA